MDTAVIQEPDTDTLLFSSKGFRVIRILLRLLSLWRPRSACFLEKYVYPVFVNLMLLTTGPIRNSIRATGKSTWLNIELLYIVHEIVICLGHILGNLYFASRDLETNVLKPFRPLTGIKEPLNRGLKILNVAIGISMAFFFIMLYALFITTHLLWSQGAQRFSAELPHIRGTVDYILYGFVLFSIAHNLGVGLALFWTLSLLYCCYAARLKIMENIFLKWKQSSGDAVWFFVEMYARPVKNSWKGISWWFLTHNIVTLAIPLYGYELAQAVSGSAYHSKHLPQFICYLIFIVTIWLAPTVVGELIKGREREFMGRINDISPGLLSHSFDEVHSVSNGMRSRGERKIDSESDATNPIPSNNSYFKLTPNPRQTAYQYGSTSTKDSDSARTLSPSLLEAESHSLDEVHSFSNGTRSHGEQKIYFLGDTESDTTPLIASNNDLNLTPNPRQTASQYGSTSTKDPDSAPTLSESTHGSDNAPTLSEPKEGSDSAPTLSEYTFASRGKELRNFLRFLKRRTPGLVSRGYSLQLNLSLISLLGVAISFLINLNSTNSEDMMYRNCNCTMS
ncbi:Hypothetical predicted protein [Paramuricea clavata]|uniref:Uncharacterized protein n=1 Tax=Paramuricea clavata TaxID=317549 RepID=A0A6S7J292_PARCT|nr:Hypothetical predicted protein [Paramuricea clavata]